MTEAETPAERRRRLLEEVPALQQSDPQRHAALVGEAAQIDATFANDARTIQHRFQQIQAWAQQQQAQAFATYAREQDAAFDKANPELQDAAKHEVSNDSDSLGGCAGSVPHPRMATDLATSAVCPLRCGN